MEVKPEEISSENVVRDRLALIRYDTFDLKLPQDITSRIWGGSMRATFPKVGKELTHGLADDFTSLIRSTCASLARIARSDFQVQRRRSGYYRRLQLLVDRIL